MKIMIRSLALILASAIPLIADSPPPATSTLEIKMTKKIRIAEDPAKDPRNVKGEHHCFANEAHYSLDPVFRRGLDAKSSKLVLSIYIITTNSKRELAILTPISQSISDDPKIPLANYSGYHHMMEWRCACKSRGDTIDKEPEWYAEVTGDGKLLCSTQSKSDTKIKKLIDSRAPVSELNIMTFSTPPTE